MIKNIEKDGQKYLKKTGDDDLDDLIRRLLVVDPKKRLTWEQYYNHPFFVSNPINNYELGNRIGENGCATIYEAKEKQNNEKIAIKIFDKNKIKAEFMQEYFRYPTEEEMEFYIKSFYNEVNHMKIIEGNNRDNKNAVKLYDYFNNKDDFIIIMELCDGNLLNVILQNKETLSIEKIRDILTQLNNSLKIMADNEIVHRDLKLENILIKKDNGKDIFKLKLTSDSCLIKDLSSEQINGNQLYISPEILKKEKYNEKCDLWSLGIIIYALSVKDYPYRGKNRKDILDKIKNNGQKNFKKTNDSNLDDLIKKLLVEDPKKRISWKEYFNHPFFNGGKKTTSVDIDIIVKNEDYSKYYDKKEKLGKGGFASVFRVVKKNTKEEKAIKIIDKQRIRNDYLNDNFHSMSEEEMKVIIGKLINEIKIMKIIKDNNNENTVQYYECFETTNEFSIIMELCDKNLTKVFTEREETFNFEEIKELLMQLNNCFRIMNEKRLCHRDLKLDNILVKYDNDNKPIWKIADYGVSKQLASISKNFSTKTGTLWFMAPEILNQIPYKEKCDLWSLGILIYVLHFRKYPYQGDTEIAMIKQINTLGQKALKKSGNSKYDDLILKLLKADPNQRIGWQEYFDHPFFNSSPLANNNYITIKLKVEKQNLRSKKIYFLENSKQEDTQNKELNETNIELYINDMQTIFNKYFEPTEEGEYEIKIIFKNQIKDCSYMFNKCNNIKRIDLSSFDSSNAMNMSYMFSECYNLNQIILNNLNTYNVKDMNHMFNKCYDLQKIDFPLSFNTQNLDNMYFMFHNCEKLLELNFSESFTTNNVTTMRGAFGKCFKLKNLDLINFNTEKVNDMSYMFDQCNNLEKIIINPSNFKTLDDKSKDLMKKCKDLESEKDNLEKQVKDYKQKFQEQEDINILKKNLDKNKNEIKELKTKLENYEKKFAENNREKDGLKNKIEEYKKNQILLQEQLQKEIEAKNEIKEKFKETIEEYDKKIKDLEKNQIPTCTTIHKNTKCEKCSINPIKGYRYKCFECDNYNLCQDCELNNSKNNEHPHNFIKLKNELINYSYECLTKKLKTYIFQGINDASISIILKNNNINQWPKNKTYLKVDENKSDIDCDNIKLKDAKQEEQETYEIHFKNLGQKSPQEYKVYLDFVVEGKKFGEQLCLSVNVRQRNNKEMIKNFKNKYKFKDGMFSDEIILKKLIENNYDLEATFFKLYFS